MANMNLPFERGATYFDGDTSAATSTGVEKLVGLEFVVPDTNHSTNVPVTLKIVQNRSDASLSTGRSVRLTTGASSFGKYAEGYVNAQGAPGYPIDDQYGDSYSIVDNDLFYVVKEGPVHMRSSTGSLTTISAGLKLTHTAQGRAQVAAANDHVVGLSQDYATATQTGSDLLVFVNNSYVNNY